MGAVSTLGPHGVPKAAYGSFAGKAGLSARWTITFQIDPDWPDNTNTLFHIKGIAALQNITVPGLPSGTQ